jgi:hypothetical protein
MVRQWSAGNKTMASTDARNARFVLAAATARFCVIYRAVRIAFEEEAMEHTDDNVKRSVDKVRVLACLRAAYST